MITLSDLFSSTSTEPWRWYVEGTYLGIKRPDGMDEPKTFVQVYPEGDIAVGYMGLLDGSFTFLAQKWFKYASRMKRTYPDLLSMPGNLWKN